MEVPVFPLPLVVLPGETVRLHIFEERYKRLMADVGAGRREAGAPFAICWVTADGVADVGTLVRVRRVTRRYPDGRMDIVVVGEGRVRVRGALRSRPYLVATADGFEDEPEDEDAAARQRAVALAAELVELLRSEPFLMEVPQHDLSFRLAVMTGLEPEVRLRLLAARSERARLAIVTDRLTRALALLEGRPRGAAEVPLGSELVN